MAGESINHRDSAVLRDILDLTRSDHPETPQERAWQLCEHLTTLIGCDEADVQWLDGLHRVGTLGPGFVDGERWIADDVTVGGDAEYLDVFWRHFWNAACSLPDRLGTDIVFSVRSTLSPREWQSDPLRTVGEPMSDEILMAYPTGPGSSSRLLLRRFEGSAFGHRELTLMRLLLPHLKGLIRSVIEPPRPTAGSRTTDRQMEVLRQAGKGLTNREIGRVLGISKATVRKHLEHAYLRLGVLSRTGAVTAVFGERSA